MENNNDKDPTTEVWKVFVCGVVLISAINAVGIYYEGQNTAIPVLCGK